MSEPSDPPHLETLGLKVRTDLKSYNSQLHSGSRKHSSHHQQIINSLRTKPVDDSSEALHSIAVPINESKMKALQEGINSVKLGSFRNIAKTPTNLGS
jgi:hypothetical protein